MLSRSTPSEETPHIDPLYAISLRHQTLVDLRTPMAQEAPTQEILDLCSDDDATTAERKPKRFKGEEVRQDTRGGIIDIGLTSSEGNFEGAQASTASGKHDRRLWGEVDGEGPPRWNYARRRTSLCQPSDVISGETHSSSRSKSTEQHREHPAAEANNSGNRNVVRQVWARRPACTLPVVPPGPEQAHHLRPRSDALLARSLQDRINIAAARQAEDEARRIEEEEELSRRINELEQLEAMEDQDFGQGMGSPLLNSANNQSSLRVPLESQQARLAGGRRAFSWAAPAIAEAMMGMLSDGSSLAHLHPGALSQHVAAVRQAMGTLQGPGRLPPHLLFSDRDFDENDYEALLALDDNIASRKGATAEQIDAIPTVVVGHSGVESDRECRCPICLEDMEPGALLRRMTCKHHFHKSCLDKWLGQKSVCPICQQSLT